jgi:hypothetical protein
MLGPRLHSSRGPVLTCRSPGNSPTSARTLDRSSGRPATARRSLTPVAKKVLSNHGVGPSLASQSKRWGSNGTRKCRAGRHSHACGDRGDRRGYLRCSPSSIGSEIRGRPQHHLLGSQQRHSHGRRRSVSHRCRSGGPARERMAGDDRGERCNPGPPGKRGAPGPSECPHLRDQAGGSRHHTREAKHVMILNGTYHANAKRRAIIYSYASSKASRRTGE